MYKTSILTYNFHFGEGMADISSLLRLYDPDICCFQEMDIDEDFFLLLKRLGYDMAGYSYSFQRLFHKTTFAIATFYNRDRYTYVNGCAYPLPRGVMEATKVVPGKRNGRTLLQGHLINAGTKKPVYVYNVHLSAYSTNMVRIKQIHRVGEILKRHERSPVLIAGDMNYAYGRKKLENILSAYGLSEATHTIGYTSIQNYGNVFVSRVKLDYIFYKNMVHRQTERINGCSSDHFPLYAEFAL